MGDLNLPDDPEAVKHTDLRWTLGNPIPPCEQVDLLMLDERELLDYASELQHETTWLRATLHEALSLLNRLTIQGERYRARIERLLAQLRTLQRHRHGEAAV